MTSLSSIDDLVAQALKGLSSSTSSSSASIATSSSTTFASLTKSLLDAGRIHSTQLESNNGVIDQIINTKSNSVEEKQSKSGIYDKNLLIAPSLKKEKVKQAKTIGKGWFDMEPMKMTESLKADVKLIQMRNALDPKRFYKNPDKMKNILHIGTVVEGPSEYLSARMTKKERKQTLVDEILADKKITGYSKKKYLQIQEVKSNKRKTFKDKHGNKRAKKVRALF